MFPHPQSLGFGQRPLSAKSRLQGARDDEFGQSRGRRPAPTAGCRAIACWLISSRWLPVPMCRSMPISKTASRRIRRASARACGWRCRAASRACPSRILPADAAAPLFELDVAIERVRAARRAIDETGADTMLIGRAECFLVGHADVAMTIARLRAYANEGADCLYAPGIRTIEHIRRRGRGRASEARQLAGELAGELTTAPNRGSRCAPRQRGRSAGARRVGRLHAGGPRTRRARHVQRPRERGLRARSSTRCSRPEL